MPRKYSEKEIRLLERAAVQLAEIDATLTDMGIDLSVPWDGKNSNATHHRFFVASKGIKIIHRSKGLWFEIKRALSWKFFLYRDKNHLAPFFGSNTALNGDAMVWVGKWVLGISNPKHQKA